MISGRLRFESTRPTEFIDLTDQIRQEVKRAGLSTGRVHLQSLHTTLGLAVNENEPLLLSDFASMLQRIAPDDLSYAHGDLSRRSAIALNAPVTGHAHRRPLLRTGFATVLGEEAAPVVRRWPS